MKERTSHIAFSGLLIAALVFSQVVVNLLHDQHDYHKPLTELQKKGVATVQEHDEHCKVCSLDILFNLLDNPTLHFDFSLPDDALAVTRRVADGQFAEAFSQDRAPPVLIFT